MECFHDVPWGFKKRCLLTIMVRQILLLTQLISEIKNTFTAANGFFSTKCFKKIGNPRRPMGLYYKKYRFVIY